MQEGATCRAVAPLVHEAKLVRKPVYLYRVLEQPQELTRGLELTYYKVLRK